MIGQDKKVQDRNKLPAVCNQLGDKESSMFPRVLTGWRQEPLKSEWKLRIESSKIQTNDQISLDKK